MTFFHSPQSYTLDLKGSRIFGYSVKDTATFFILPKLKVGFDIGMCVKEHSQVDHLFISSMKNDRIAGLRSFLSMKAKRGCSIYTHEQFFPILVDEINLLVRKYETEMLSPKIKLISLKEESPIQVSGRLSVRVKSKIGYTLFETKEKVRPEIMEEFKSVKKKGEFIKEKGRENVFMKVETVTWSYFPSPQSSSIPSEMFDSTEYLICSIPSFGQSLEFIEQNEDEFSKLMRRTRDDLSKSKGKGVIFCDLEKYLACSGNIHYFFYILPRIPKSILEKINLLPHSDLIRFKKRAYNLTDFQIDFERLKKCREDYPKYEFKVYSEDEYILRQHLGYAGARKFKMKQELVKKYGNDYVKAYLYFKDDQKIFVDRDYALLLYEESYYQFLDKHREIYEYICNEGIDVYDTEKENIYSGYDYHKQDAKKPTHLQDIAVRRAIKRLGGSFRGNRLLWVRGIDSELYCLNPGFVKFVRPEFICREHLFVRDWTLDGSVECFWQSNKVILTKKEN